MGVGAGVGTAPWALLLEVGAGVGKGVGALPPPQATAIRAASSRQGRNRIFNRRMSVLQIRVGIVSKWSGRGREMLGVGQRDSSGTGGSRTAPTGMTGGDWGSPTCARTTGGASRLSDGFPPPSSRGRALRGNDGGGWVPASARTTGGGGGMRDGVGGWVPVPVFTRAGSLRGNDGGGWVPASARTTGGGGGMRDGVGGWVPAPVFTRAGSAGEQQMGPN